jgi:hypothetical protein
MSDLILNQDELEQLKADLRTVTVAFKDIDGISQAVADQVGHHGDLSGRVRDFATGWDDRRTKISESLDIVERAYSEIFRAFNEADSQMDGVLHGQTKPGASA